MKNVCNHAGHACSCDGFVQKGELCRCGHPLSDHNITPIEKFKDWDNVMTTDNDLMCLSLPVDLTDEQIKECVQGMMPVCFKRRQGFCLSISGFDFDSRELWQIPEAISFMQKLVKFGVISGLEVTTTIPELMAEHWEGKKLPGFGAIEVWMCANGMLASGKTEVDGKIFKKFSEVLTRANQVADAICKEKPYEAGFKSHDFKNSHSPNFVPDAPIKHSGFRKH